MTRHWLGRVGVVAEVFGLDPRALLRGRSVEFVGLDDMAGAAERARAAREWQVGMAARQLQLRESGLEEFREWVTGLDEVPARDPEEVQRMMAGLRARLMGRG